ncbi:MAG: hypothetical protein C4290_00990 [Chloroflexota bacterium]
MDWYVVDVGSRNGSTWNGQRLTPEHAVRVQPGDVPQLGGAFITVLATDPAAPSPPREATAVAAHVTVAAPPTREQARPPHVREPDQPGGPRGARPRQRYRHQRRLRLQLPSRSPAMGRRHART